MKSSANNYEPSRVEVTMFYVHWIKNPEDIFVDPRPELNQRRTSVGGATHQFFDSGTTTPGY